MAAKDIPHPKTPRKELPSAEYLRSILSYTPETGVLLWKWRADRSAPQNLRWSGKVAGSPNTNGHLQVQVGKSLFLASRLIWVLVTGAPPTDEVDHINGIRDDNRWANLRQASREQNCFNRKCRSDSTTAIKGVSHRRTKHGKDRWRATIMLLGKRTHLGYFNTLEDARAAYCKAAKELHGEFTRMEEHYHRP